MTTHEQERGVVSCAICLTQKSPEEAYLDGCFHRFCLSCISRWTDSQRQHPPAGAAPGFVCPLCKTPYASILHDYRHNAYKRKWVAQQGAGTHSLPDGAAVDLTPLQRRRRARYFSPRSAARASGSSSGSSGSGNGAAVLTAAQAARPEVAAWLRRELEALMLESDVGMVVAHVVGTLRSATGGPAKHRRGAAATAGASREAVAAAVAAAAQPYIFEHAGRLAQELFEFAASGRSIAAHDLATGMAGGNSKPAAQLAAAAAGEDGSRESGELSPSQPSDSQDDSSSGNGAAGADMAASFGSTPAAAVAGPAANVGAGSGVQHSPSPDRGSDCLSLSVGSDFGDSDSEAYLPLVQASAAAQRRKLEAAAAGGGSEPESNGTRCGTGAQDLAGSPPRSKRQRSHPDARGSQQRQPDRDTAVDGRRGHGPGAHGAHNAAAGSSRPQRQHKRRRPSEPRQPARQPRVSAAAAMKTEGAAAAAADADAQRMLRRAAKFGMPLPAPVPPLGPSPVATAAVAPSTHGNPRGTAAIGKKSAQVPSNSQRRSSRGRSAEAQPDGSGRPRAPPTALKPGQLRPLVEAEADPAQPAAIESPTAAPLMLQQGGRQAKAERSSGQQHRRRQQQPADPRVGSLQPVPTPGCSSDSAAVRSGAGAAQGASNGARHAGKQGRDGVPSLGGGLRIFRSAMGADGPPLRGNGSILGSGRGGASGNGVARGSAGGGADSGSLGSQDLELLRQRALAAHAVPKP